MKQIDLTKEYKVEEPYNIFLDKKEALNPIKVKILNICKGNRASPYFLVSSLIGEKYFDFNNIEFNKFLLRYGKEPSKWINQEFYIKAIPYENKGKKGLQWLLCEV